MVLFALPLVLLLTSPARCSVDGSLVATTPPPKSLVPLLLNNTPIYSALPVLNVSDSQTLAIVYPYSFSVPNTQIFLRLGFGLVRHRLDPMSLAGLIAVMEFEVVEGIDRDGEDAYPGLNIVIDEQRFGWTLYEGFHFEVYSVRDSGRFFTWGQLSHVVEGLRLFLVVGERPFATKFKFWDGPGRWRRELGGGAFVVDGDEDRVGDIAGQKG